MSIQQPVKLSEIQTFLYSPKNSVIYWILVGACITITVPMPYLGIPLFIIYMLIMFVGLKNKRSAFWQQYKNNQEKAK